MSEADLRKPPQFFDSPERRDLARNPQPASIRPLYHPRPDCITAKNMPVTPPLSPASPDPLPSARIRRVIASKGTLEYTLGGLVLLFFYMLWGDLCIQLMELDVPSIIPLQLRELGASNTYISVIGGIIPTVCSMTMNPFFSFCSDRTRTRLGRRRPYLLASAPIVTLVLVGLGFTPELAGALGRGPFGAWLGAHPHTLQLGLFAALVALFHFFNSALQPIYAYLVIDVIPDRYLGRFLAVFRIVASLAGFLFQRFVFGHALSHTRLVYGVTAGVFFFGFLLMCWRVKESEYPPPVHASRLGLVGAVRIYLRECFSHPHYFYFFGRFACYRMAYLNTDFMVFARFYFRDHLGLPLAAIGDAMSWAYFAAALVLFPIGLLCDKYGATRFSVVASWFNLPAPLLAFFFVRDETSMIVFCILLHLGRTLYDGTLQPLGAQIYPRERYGQFGSANQAAGSIVALSTAPLVGWVLDRLTDDNRAPAGYRWIFLWVLALNVVALVCMILLYRSWRRHGGPDNYVPPIGKAA